MRYTNHSVCRACYDADYPGRTPVALVEPHEECCCSCGELTTEGVYERGAVDFFDWPYCQCEKAKEEPCLWCEEPIGDEDAETRYHVDGDGYARGAKMHMACSLRSIVGSVGHQRGTCGCFGGTEEDPPGLTKREAARAALEEFKTRQRSVS